MLRKRICKTIISGLTACALFLSPLAGVSGQNVSAAQKADKSVLSDLIEQAEKADVDGYSSESVDFFTSAIRAAKIIEEDEDVSDEEVEKYQKLLEDAYAALIQKDQENVVYDGTYSIDGRMWHATSDQPSMGNAALKQPMYVVKKGDTLTLRMEFVSLTTKLGTTDFTGYLGELNYYPGYTSDGVPYDETPTPVEVESYYEDLYDYYNDPSTGTDSYMKGKEYPHFMRMPISFDTSDYWVQVYVPVMEAISAGSGRQNAKLQLDWSTLTQISGTETEKTELKAEVTQLTALKKYLLDGNGGTYPDAVMTLLEKAITAGTAANDNLNIDQAAVDAATKVLRTTKTLFGMDETAPDKGQLEKTIAMAQGYLSQETYTSATKKNLQDALTAAQKVYDDVMATQSDINDQTAKLALAILGLEIKQTASNSGSANNAGGSSNSASSNSSNTNSASGKKTKSSKKLNIKKLEDGVYSIEGEMVKIDKKTASMSNEAINHTLKLTVKKGKYSITMDFSGLEINTQFGYLSSLKYFKTGYKLDKYGNPTGTLGKVTVDSYQKNADGSLVSDSFGTNYPDLVTFPLISEALDDGYVPLQVFVPIMDAISKGTGTQPVFLKLDLTSVASVTDESVFTKDSGSKKKKSSGSAKSGSSGLKGGSSLTGGSSLKSNSSLKSGGLSNTSANGGGTLSGTGTLTGTGTLEDPASDASAASADTGSSGSSDAAAQENIGEPPLKKYVGPTAIIVVLLAGGSVTYHWKKKRARMEDYKTTGDGKETA